MLTWTRRLAIVVVVSLVSSCGDNYDAPPDAPPPPACSDRRDNDGDGVVDFPDDLGCESADADSESSPVRPECNDNRDNDDDGLKDYPDDPGCLLPESAGETDDCPDGPLCPQCANNVDDDASGARDFPADLGCESAADNFEYAGNPQACGAGLTLKPLPASGVDMGVLDSSSLSNIPTPCGGGGGAPAIGYVMVLNRPTIVAISTAGSFVNTVLDLRRPACQDSGSSLACHDDVAPSDRTSRITRSLAAGVYYIIVQGKDATQAGMYTITVRKFKVEGEMCNVQSECGPGLFCRIPAGGTQKICTRPVCSDGLDDDADGKIDFPNDPGCLTEADPDEVDDCPGGPTCPKCSDAVDNDGDGNTDYPSDESCKAAGDGSEACITSEKPIAVITAPVTQGTTVGAVNDYDPTCNSATGMAPDMLYRLELPDVTTLSLNVAGFDSVHTLLDSTCGGTPIRCSDPANMTVGPLAAGTYYLVIDAWFNTASPFTLTTSGTVAPGGSCEGELFQNGALTCPTGLVCDGLPGARTCRAQCSDGVDNNGDGKIDYPNDPGCSALNDNTEDSVCPGAMCPVCSDGADNDSDTFTDYPADPSCIAANGVSETCRTTEPILPITSSVTTGTTVGVVNDYDPTCNSTTGLAPDVFHQLDVPAMATLNLRVTGFNTVHSLLDSTCGGTPIRCSDPELMTVTGLAAGTYYVGIEGFSTTTGAYTLTTTGEVAPGESCEGTLFQNGAFTCTSGYACDGVVGMRTCQIADCSDGMDNNGDGKIDYPNDPGCTGPSDDVEDTVCPGAMCPVCSDGADNDGDTLIDYPTDTSCLAANGVSEACGTTEPVIPVTGSVTMGTTVGATNDYDPTCNSSTGLSPDVFYELDLPGMATLNLNVTGFDTVHSLLDSTCGGTPIRCSDPPNMAVTNLAAGKYYLGVEGYGTTTGAFTLTTTGQVAPGESCEGMLFQSGAFTCTPGHACDGPAGMRTCRTVECNDGMDNNGDGEIDFPNDPGCANLSDTTENTVCPGPTCPACSDGIDNDSDGQTDFPADTSCKAASGLIEACNGENEPILPIVSGTTMDTLVGATHTHVPSCGSSGGADKLFTLDLPPMATLRLDTEGSTISDTVLSLLNSTCNEPSIECDDDDGTGFLSLIQRTNVPAGLYVVAVDAYSSSTSLNAFHLNVSGTIAPGGSCESPLFQSGAFTCTTGFNCLGPAGARRCAAECSDGLDNNSDGKIDYPADPGCTSAGDLTENTVCPGASCPACSNQMDDDGDALVDWPADFGCGAASGTTEAFCPTDPDYRGAITTPVTTGTLAAPAADNGEQTCQANTGNDVVYSLISPVSASWVINTNGSTINDTVLSLHEASCTSAPLACDDDSGPGPLSQISIALPAGTYAIQVDGYTQTGNNGPFQLNVQGTAQTGSDCTTPLFTSGVLVCPVGQSCTAGICQ